MEVADLKKIYGDEYPAAVIRDGIRMPLRRERRFSRSYHSDEHKMGSEVSRFMDGSASITSSQLQQEWPRWSEDVRLDFCEACAWLHEQPDFPEMVRFIMEHGGPDEWSAVALHAGSELPQDEAFDLLTRVLRSTDLDRACNISQGISLTRHPDAERVLRAHLSALWSHPSLWDDDEFINWIAYGATCSIEHLIDVGARPGDFADHVRQLAKHACAGNRDSCRNFLSKHYSWLE